MSNETIRGTIAELAGRVTVNGNVVDQPGLSVLTRLGIGKQVGVTEKPENQRGRAATIWEFPLESTTVLARK